MGKGNKTEKRTVGKPLEKRPKIAEGEPSQAKSREYTECLSDIFKGSAQPFAIGYPDGRLMTFNAAYCELLGYSGAELKKLKWSTELTPPEFHELMAKVAEEISRTGQPQQFEKEYIRKDGSRVPVHVFSHPISDDKGNIQYYWSIFTDITEYKRAEEYLRNREKEFATLVENATDMIVRFDTDLRHIYCSSAVERQLGVPVEVFLGKTPLELEELGKQLGGQPGEEARIVDRSLRQVLETGVEQEVEQSAHTPFGLKHFQTRIVPERDASGKIISVLAITRDVTERKQSEEKLRRTAYELATIIESTADGILVIDNQGAVLYSNSQFKEMWRIPDALIASKDDQLLLDFVLDQLVDPETFLAKVQMLYQTDMQDWDALYFKDGRIFERFSCPLIQNERIAGRVWSFRDVTKHKRAGEALRQSEERYRTILEETAEGYYEVDLAGTFIFVNYPTTILWGYSKEEIVGRNYRFLFPEQEQKNIFNAFNRVYRTGQPVRSLNFEGLHKDGSKRIGELSVFPLRNEKGEIIGFRGIGRDTTQRKIAEEERRQLELKAQATSRLASVGEMAAGVAHEINNPLTGVIGYAQLLMDREDVPLEIRADLAAINDGARRVANIVRTLLAFSRQTEPQQKLVDINELIESTLVLRAYHLKVNNIEVVTRLTTDLPETVADPGQIQQVLLNLIVNAETEMKLAHGKGKITITTEKSHNTIKICCQDDGPGIKPEVMDRIFDPFFTTREVGQGTGLGLSLCYGIIAEHKGKIYAESQPGKGATFVVELPVVTEVAPPKPSEPVVKKSKKKVKARILVVDDEQMIRDVVNRVLTGEGHKVETVDNAAEALKKIESQKYNLILVDIKMPGISGVTLYKRIQKTDKSLAQKVVFITGDIMSADTQKFLSETKVAHIDKPFNAEQLSREVKRALTGGR